MGSTAATIAPAKTKATPRPHGIRGALARVMVALDDGTVLVRRWLRGVVTVAPCPVLAGATALALIGPGDSARPVWPTLGLAALTAGWFGLTRLWRPEEPSRGWLPAGFFLGLLVLVAGLVAWSPWYSFVSWLVFPVALVLFSSRGAVVALITATVVVTMAQTRPWPLGWPEPSYPLLLTVVLPLLAAAWLVSGENDERRALLAERAELQRRLVDQARQAGVATERARLARELHDTVAQALAATVAQLEAAQQAENDPARWRPHVTNAADLARSGLAEARRSVQALRPAALDGHDLTDALRELADETSDAVEVRFEVVGEPRPLAPEVEHALYRVTQEALANSAEHARASTVYLTVSWMDDLALVDVRDDGCGFEPGQSPLAGEATTDRGFGMAAMRQRMLRVGGVLVVEAIPGEGTAVCASVPLAMTASQECG